MALETAFQLDLPPGLCLAVALPPRWDSCCEQSLTTLPAAEQQHAGGLREPRRLSWVGGRVALHRSAAQLGIDCAAVLPGVAGAPLLPIGLRASISHSRRHAVALVERDQGSSIGVDIETLAPARPHIARLVLTAAEQQALAALPVEQQWDDLLVRFSAKEAIYKALFPTLRRRVDFSEVAVWPGPASTLRVEFLGEVASWPLQPSARVYQLGDQLLTTARIAS